MFYIGLLREIKGEKSTGERFRATLALLLLRCHHGYFFSDDTMFIFRNYNWYYYWRICWCWDTGLPVEISTNVLQIRFIQSISGKQSPTGISYEYIFFLSLKIVIVSANNADPVEMSHYVVFHLVFIICQSTCLQVSSVKVLRRRRFTGFWG